MTDPKPYSATLEELRAIDEALAQEAELPMYYRGEAARLRAQADAAGMAEIRMVLLAMAMEIVGRSG
jgi:hypothetical protein